MSYKFHFGYCFQQVNLSMTNLSLNNNSLMLHKIHISIFGFKELLFNSYLTNISNE